MKTPGKLEITTPTDSSIVMTRSFAAPRGLVFEALTRPELVRRWLGADGWTMLECEIDPRPGGAYRYSWQGPRGERMVLRGVYREVVPPARIVQTEVNEDCGASDGAETIVTAELTEADGTTELKYTIVYPSREIRDAVIESGMEEGIGQGFRKLEAILAQSV